MKKTVLLLNFFIIVSSFLALNAQKVHLFKLGSRLMSLQQTQALIAQSDPQLRALFRQASIQHIQQTCSSAEQEFAMNSCMRDAFDALIKKRKGPEALLKALRQPKTPKRSWRV